MSYLFAAYMVIWILLSGYLVILGKRQQKINKEIEFIRELENTQ
ncbi:CcmD family protein [Chengkuizengella marina]|uniref:CcmD family protein n=1 Tax=Chengkuizengella marina TaxID=2507566 RepID=A0A6N9Q3Y0_9BACL|nr:CcmD family protein [Chengkuizengella marina]NBI29539.1 CcmD family protein [Chengkuizengella marina]